MKPLFLLFACCAGMIQTSFAHNWYISASGDDGYNGSFDYPWKTVDKLNMAFPYLAAGDSVFFKAGEVFAGQLRFNAASSDAIYIGAYGSGNKPVITGFTTVTGWTEVSTNIWQATLNGTARVGMLTVNGVVTPMGRYPNRGGANDGYNVYQSPVSTTTITDPSLSGSPNWTGAEVVIRKTRWVIDHAPVTSQSSACSELPTPTIKFLLYIQHIKTQFYTRIVTGKGKAMHWRESTGAVYKRLQLLTKKIRIKTPRKVDFNQKCWPNC